MEVKQFLDTSGTALTDYPPSHCGRCATLTEYEGWAYDPQNGLEEFIFLKCGKVKYDKHFEDVTDRALLAEIREVADWAAEQDQADQDGLDWDR